MIETYNSRLLKRNSILPHLECFNILNGGKHTAFRCLKRLLPYQFKTGFYKHFNRLDIDYKIILTHLLINVIHQPQGCISLSLSLDRVLPAVIT